MRESITGDLLTVCIRGQYWGLVRVSDIRSRNTGRIENKPLMSALCTGCIWGSVGHRDVLKNFTMKTSGTLLIVDSCAETGSVSARVHRG